MISVLRIKQASSEIDEMAQKHPEAALKPDIAGCLCLEASQFS